MKKFQRIKSFILGVIITAVIGNFVINANAALVSKKIDVLTGVSVYVDGVKFEPVDSNGNPIEIFTYNGVTYLPSENLAVVLGKSIYWNQESLSLYLATSPLNNNSSPSVAKLQETNNKDEFYYELSKTLYSTFMMTLKNPSSLTIFSIYGGYSDNFYEGRDVIIMDISAMNSMGGYTRQYYMAWYDNFGDFRYNTTEQGLSQLQNPVTLDVDKVVK